MVKHIFIAPIKEGVTDDQIEFRMKQMRDLMTYVPELKQLTVQKATGWLGVSDSVVLVAELNNKQDWEKFIHNTYHVELGKSDDTYFKTDQFVCTQIEY